MHFRSITRIVGLLVILFSVTMIIPGIVALIYRMVQDEHLVRHLLSLLLLG